MAFARGHEDGVRAGRGVHPMSALPPVLWHGQPMLANDRCKHLEPSCNRYLGSACSSHAEAEFNCLPIDSYQRRRSVVICLEPDLCI